jgi:hypothetical protein
VLYGQGAMDALFIDQSGNVGVGTTTPQGFQIVLPEANKPNAPKAGITLAGGLNGNASIEVRNNGEGTPYIDFAQKTGVDYDARLRLTAPGQLAIEGTDVGIGTTTPTHKFHVVAQDAVGLFESSGNQAYLRLSTNEGLENRVEITNRPGGRLSLWTREGGDVFNITKDGKVGIGRTDPKTALDVKGEIRGKLWTSIEYEWSQYDKTTKIMTKSDRSMCFLTYVSGLFAGAGEAVEIKEQNGYWVLMGRSQQKDVRARAKCIGAPDDSW